MKKILVFIAFVAAAIGVIYFTSPTTNSFNYKIGITIAEDAAARQILDTAKWNRWWPGSKENESTYLFKGCMYRIDKLFNSGLAVTVFKNNDSSKAIFELNSISNSSTQFSWSSAFNFSDNYLKRWLQNFQFKNINKNISELSTAMNSYFSRQENIYGLLIKQKVVTDTSLMSLKENFNHYPSLKDIYKLVDSLKKYIAGNGGEERNSPMLNVYEVAAGDYECMVAIPTKTDMPSQGGYHLKKMIRGNILTAEIRGGPVSILKAEQELSNYVNDYKKSSPAIPYQLLVTNRQTEPDTLKWITELYYPIFY